MKFKNYYDFEEYLTKLCSEKEYDLAIDSLHNSKEYLPEDEYKNNSFELLFLEAYIFTLSKNIEGCITAIKKILDKGYSLPMHWPRFNYLSEHKDYNKLRKINDEHLNNSREKSTFEYDVYLPKSYDSSKKYPLFFVLHGDGFDCNKKSMIQNWKKDIYIDRDYIVVYPQSSQPYCTNGFGWLQNPELSRDELKKCYEDMLNSYSIDKNNIIIGGFSGGATAAIDLAVNDTFPIKGVSVLCPGDYLDKLSIDDLAPMKNKGTKVFILDGEEGSDPAMEHILKVFKEADLSFKYIVNKGVGHEFPKDFDAKLIDSLDFIHS